MGPPRTPASAWAAGSLLFYSLMVAVAVGIAWWRGAPLQVPGPSPRLELAGGLGLGALASLLCYWTRGRRFMRSMARDLAGALGPLPGWAILVVAGASGVGEELLFRGALQPWMGLIPTAFLFALMHPPLSPGLWAWPWMALGAGLVLGLLAEGTGGLLAPIGLHAALNAGNMAWIVSMEEACASDPPSSPC